MKDVSENLVVGPAKKVNPKEKMIIKFPNWRESYHATGYRPDVEKDIFDMVYTGTETRASAYQDQHLPTYLSYSLVRWMDEASANVSLEMLCAPRCVEGIKEMLQPTMLI